MAILSLFLCCLLLLNITIAEFWFTETYAGDGTRGYNNGPSLSASFDAPMDIAADAQGNVYVADSDNRAVRIVRPDNEVDTFLQLSIFQQPSGVGVDANNKALFVADPSADAIFAVNLNTHSWSTVLQHDNMLSAPNRLAIHSSGHLIVTSVDKHAVYVVLLGCEGDPLRPCTCRVAFMGLSFPSGTCVFAVGSETHAGYQDGSVSLALFYFPRGIAIGSDGVIFVADSGNDAVRMIALYHGSGPDSLNPATFWQSLSNSRVQTLVGGTSRAFPFHGPAGLGINPSGSSIFVADTNGHQVVQIDMSESPLRITTIAGTGSPGYSNGQHAEFDLPQAVAVMSDAKIVVVDSHRNVLRSVSNYELAQQDASHGDDGRHGKFWWMPLLAAAVVLVACVAYWKLRHRLRFRRCPLPAYRRVTSDTRSISSYLETSF